MALERELARSGKILGHFPQSFEVSTVGGWIATRSCGQQSYHYGRIENLFAGGHIETPLGPLDLPPLPASGAGPDLRQVILGSEGRLGVITKAVLRVQTLPEREAFYGAFFRDWSSGVMALRNMAQAKIPLSMMRLSDAQETDVTLVLSGKKDLAQWAERGLGLLGFDGQRCLFVYGITGDSRRVRLARLQAAAAIREQRGFLTGPAIGKMWVKSRFRTPYLRNTIWEAGYALDTLETAMPWSRVEEAAEKIKMSLRDGLSDQGEKVLAFAHVSSVYPDGASLYVSYMFRRSEDPSQTLENWQKLKHAASQAITSVGGTISHQHGVGTDHAPYLAHEKGQLGLELIDTVCKKFDPHGMMNPGKLLPTEIA
jgi:alkyldihydroxyacetonephosphate synthase